MQLLVFGTCATTTVIMVVSSASQLVIHPSYPQLRAPLLFHMCYGPVKAHQLNFEPATPSTMIVDSLNSSRTLAFGLPTMSCVLLVISSLQSFFSDFFIDERAIADYKNRLRYIVARYGYSTSVFAWEFFNEVHSTEICL